MKVALVTGSRSEWRLVEPLMREAARRAGVTPLLLVTGTHLSPRHGHTLDVILKAGFKPAVSIEILEQTDTPLSNARATGRGVMGFADVLAREPPDWVVVTGDRYESFAAAAAATLVGVPLAHIAGGETDLATNYDCNLRNAMTKLAHAHCVSHETARRRVLAMGEEAWRVRTVGLPSLDHLVADCPPRAALETAKLIPRGRPFVLCSFYPVTNEPAAARGHLETLLFALDRLDDVHKLLVLSNSDAGSDQIDARVAGWAAGRSDVTTAASLDPPLFAAALKHCACYAGNSSSGVIEAPVFGTPAVIVGTRQSGRPRADSTQEIQSPAVDSLAATIQNAIVQGRHNGVSSPYGDGRSAPRVFDALAELRGRPDLLLKRLVSAETHA